MNNVFEYEMYNKRPSLYTFQMRMENNVYEINFEVET
jgi:hypothetical protein